MDREENINGTHVRKFLLAGEQSRVSQVQFDFADFYAQFEEVINIEDNEKLLQLLQQLDQASESTSFYFPEFPPCSSFFSLFFNCISPNNPPEIRSAALNVIRNLTFGCYYEDSFFTAVVDAINQLLFVEETKDHLPVVMQILRNICTKSEHTFRARLFEAIPFENLVSILNCPDLTPFMIENIIKFIVALVGYEPSPAGRAALLEVISNKEIPSEPFNLLLCWLYIRHPDIFDEVPGEVVAGRVIDGLQSTDPKVLHPAILVFTRLIERDPGAAQPLVNPEIFQLLKTEDLPENIFNSLLYLASTLIEKYGADGALICSNASVLELGCGSSPDELTIGRKVALVHFMATLLKGLNREQITQVFSPEIFDFMIEYLGNSDDIPSRIALLEALYVILHGFEDEVEDWLQSGMESQGGWDIVSDLMDSSEDVELQHAATQLYMCHHDDLDMPDLPDDF